MYLEINKCMAYGLWCTCTYICIYCLLTKCWVKIENHTTLEISHKSSSVFYSLYKWYSHITWLYTWKYMRKCLQLMSSLRIYKEYSSKERGWTHTHTYTCSTSSKTTNKIKVLLFNPNECIIIDMMMLFMGHLFKIELSPICQCFLIVTVLCGVLFLCRERERDMLVMETLLLL